jgi:aspartate/glutamate racemase
MPEAAKLLEPYFRKLEAEQMPYILANITLHEAVAHFTIKPKHFISIEAILQHEIDQKALTVGLLGTSYTMTNDYWKKTYPYLQFKPLSTGLLAAVDDLRKCYYQDANKTLALKTFKLLKSIQVDFWIIACTELALAYDDADIELPLIHLPKLQCDYLIKSIIPVR